MTQAGGLGPPSQVPWQAAGYLLSWKLPRNIYSCTVLATCSKLVEMPPGNLQKDSSRLGWKSTSSQLTFWKFSHSQTRTACWKSWTFPQGCGGSLAEALPEGSGVCHEHMWLSWSSACHRTRRASALHAVRFALISQMPKLSSINSEHISMSIKWPILTECLSVTWPPLPHSHQTPLLLFQSSSSHH